MSTSFEISDPSYMVKIEPLELSYYDADNDWDANWIKSKVSVKAGNFHGDYTADFRTHDFVSFKKHLEVLYDNLSGAAEFYDIEGYLELKIYGDGIGHFEVQVDACDNPGHEARHLTFTMHFDQTYIKGFVNDLNAITQEFPIIGN